MNEPIRFSVRDLLIVTTISCLSLGAFAAIGKLLNNADKEWAWKTLSFFFSVGLGWLSFRLFHFMRQGDLKLASATLVSGALTAVPYAVFLLFSNGLAFNSDESYASVVSLFGWIFLFIPTAILGSAFFSLSNESHFSAFLDLSISVVLFLALIVLFLG